MGNVFFFFLKGLCVHAAVRGGTCAFTLKIVIALIKNSSRDDRLRSRHRSNPRPTRFVSAKAGECRGRPRIYQVDPWSRGRELGRGVLRSSPKPEQRPIFCHRRGIEKLCPLFSTQQRPNVFVSDAWPAPATYHRWFCEHCDRRWVGAPNERAPFRFHGAVVVFVDRCLSRTRNLAVSN